jgi:hypothetical protein
VRDIAAHLLGDDLNRLSPSRDEHSGEGPRPGESLPEFIHRINDEWWLDCARDFTEFWIHQEQIRDATGRHDVEAPEGVHAVLDTFLRAVPYTLEERPQAEGTSVAVQVDGPGGGRWSWRHDGGVWRPVQSEPGRGTVVRFDAADTVWRLGTRMISPAEAGRRAEVTGDDELAQQVLQIVCVIR